MATNTLDGMTVEQLRDLAKRAEAAAKVQEEKSRISVRCKDASHTVSVGKDDNVIRFTDAFGDTVKSVVGEWTVNRLLANVRNCKGGEGAAIVSLLQQVLDSK